MTGSSSSFSAQRVRSRPYCARALWSSLRRGGGICGTCWRLSPLPSPIAANGGVGVSALRWRILASSSSRASDASTPRCASSSAALQFGFARIPSHICSVPTYSCPRRRLSMMLPSSTRRARGVICTGPCPGCKLTSSSIWSSTCFTSSFWIWRVTLSGASPTSSRPYRKCSVPTYGCPSLVAHSCAVISTCCARFVNCPNIAILISPSVRKGGARGSASGLRQGRCPCTLQGTSSLDPFARLDW